MSITAGELYSRARAKIGLNFQDGRLDDNNIAGVNTFINSGLVDMSAETDWDWLYAEESFRTSPGVEQYGLPRNHLRTLWIADSDGNELQLAQRRKALKFFGRQGPARFFSVANGAVWIAPVPATAATLRHGYYTHIPEVSVETVAELDDVVLKIPAMWQNFAALFIAKHIALSLRDANLHGAVTAEMQMERQRLADNIRKASGPMAPSVRTDA